MKVTTSKTTSNQTRFFAPLQLKNFRFIFAKRKQKQLVKIFLATIKKFCVVQ